ncbi:hypothetical protein EG68_07490 [Paragonimus skrjabini miyazakii]|uniref:J domain-containing protein n=1 Tax=Paragonimus skrjabini miyazakii TaxID=59628 RepID=A0A8S9YRA4_9TREM|nr:hypothetical protein EG68_07490 [Paragonimus skrjabini miyazakii]
MTKQNDQTNQLMIRELCRILEVQADVTVQDLKKAYYRLAKRFHPDKNPSDALATNQFILVSSAYQTLRSELTLDDIPNTEQATNVHQKTTVRRANSAQKPTNTDTTLSPASKPSRHKYEGIQIDELLARLFQTNFNNITTKTDTNNTTQARHCPKDERQKLSDNLTETDSKFPDRTSSQTAKEIIFNSGRFVY